MFFLHSYLNIEVAVKLVSKHKPLVRSLKIKIFIMSMQLRSKLNVQVFKKRFSRRRGNVHLYAINDNTYSIIPIWFTQVSNT